MRKSFLPFIFSFAVFSGHLQGQSSYEKAEHNLNRLFTSLMHISDDNERKLAADSINLILRDYVNSGSVFTHRFTRLKYLGQVISPDTVLKIVSWNLVMKNEPGKYYCFIIRKSGKTNPNKIFELSAGYNAVNINADTIYNANNWYGALYYDIRKFKADEQDSWILLGVDFGNPEMTRKIIDILRFSPDGSIIFGEKCFSAQEIAHYRAVLEYSPDAMMTMRFYSDSSVVFDHLVPVSSSASHLNYAPDYSFDAYNLSDGIWVLSINVDARNKEQSKQPKPLRINPY